MIRHELAELSILFFFCLPFFSWFGMARRLARSEHEERRENKKQLEIPKGMDKVTGLICLVFFSSLFSISGPGQKTTRASWDATSIKSSRVLSRESKGTYNNTL